MQGHGPANVLELGPLDAATEQQDQRLPFLRQVDAITRTPVDNTLAQTAKPLQSAGVSLLDPGKSGGDLRGSLRIEGFEPATKRASSVEPRVLDYARGSGQMVTLTLPLVNRFRRVSGHMLGSSAGERPMLFRGRAGSGPVRVLAIVSREIASGQSGTLGPC